MDDMIKGEILDNYCILQEAIRNVQDMIFIKNAKLEYVAVSDSFARLVGKPAEEIIGKSDYDVFESRQLAEKYRSDDKRLLIGKKNIYNMVEPLPEVEGRRNYAATSKKLLMGADGEPGGIMGVTRELGQLRPAQQHFWTEMRSFLELGESDYYVMIADLNEWKVLERRLNPKCHAVPRTDLCLDEILASARRHVNPEAREALEFYNRFSLEYMQEIYQSGKSQIVLEYLHDLTGDDVQWMQDIIYLRTNLENGHLYMVIVLHSVEEQRRKALQLRKEAETDGLTGLLNRHYFIRKCQNYLENEGANSEHAFFMMDVDNFKKINDTYGHQNGDRFLESLGAVLQEGFRSEDLIARLGGDEFVALLKNVKDEGVVRDRAGQILAKVRSTVTKCAGVEPSISMGISLYPRDGTNVDALYGNADIALYEAKCKRNNCFRFYSEEQF